MRRSHHASTISLCAHPERPLKCRPHRPRRLVETLLGSGRKRHYAGVGDVGLQLPLWGKAAAVCEYKWLQRPSIELLSRALARRIRCISPLQKGLTESVHVQISIHCRLCNQRLHCFDISFRMAVALRIMRLRHLMTNSPPLAELGDFVWRKLGSALRHQFRRNTDVGEQTSELDDYVVRGRWAASGYNARPRCVRRSTYVRNSQPWQKKRSALVLRKGYVAVCSFINCSCGWEAWCSRHCGQPRTGAFDVHGQLRPVHNLPSANFRLGNSLVWLVEVGQNLLSQNGWNDDPLFLQNNARIE